MKIKILLICIFLYISCANKNSQTRAETDVSNEFVAFLDKFNTMPKELRVVNSFDMGGYGPKRWSDTYPKEYIINPLLKVIDESEYLFIKSKYPTGSDFQYYSLYKKNVNSYFALIITQDNDSTQEYWLTLNIFDKKGDLIDTLIIAGQEVEQRDRFCVIDSNFIINIREEKCIPPFEENSSDILETKETYVVSSSGHFQKIKSSKKRGRYVYHEKEDEYMLEFYDE